MNHNVMFLETEVCQGGCDPQAENHCFRGMQLLRKQSEVSPQDIPNWRDQEGEEPATEGWEEAGFWERLGRKKPVGVSVYHHTEREG